MKHAGSGGETGREAQGRGVAMLTIATLIWGTSLVAQRLGSDDLGPFAFNAARFLLGSAVLLPIVIARKAHSAKLRSACGQTSTRRTSSVRGGMLCGLIVFATAAFQQIGIAHTTVGKAGFITSLYIVIVPLFGLLEGKRPRTRTLGCIALAVAGMYLLCMREGLAINLGDALVLTCAFTTALHIAVLDRLTPYVDCFELSCIQFLACGILSLVVALLAESPSLEAIASAGAPILYTGILSCGVAYTLQAWGQKTVEPITASLVLSMESVFSVLSGWIVLGQAISPREALGCALMFAAIVISCLPRKP